MITNKMSKRLRQIVELVDGKRVADIGCDHGKVVNYLLSHNIIDYAICSDISLPSVKKAEELLLYSKIDSSRYDIRHGDGLSTVTYNDNIDTIIIAGMGGKEIIHILSTAQILPETLILQPQKNEIEVKKYLINNGYHIVFDKIVEDSNKFYICLKCKKDSFVSDVNEFELLFGKDNFVNYSKDFDNYLKFLQKKYQHIASNITDCDRHNIDNMLESIEKAKDLFRSIQ